MPSDEIDFEVERVEVLASDPPIHHLYIDGQKLILSTEELLSPRRFRRKFVEKLRRIPTLPGRKAQVTYDEHVNEWLRSAEIVPLPPPGRRGAMAGGLLVLVLAALPAVAGDFVLGVAGEILIFALFAASLQVLMGVGGMISFGHAAVFGLGAYGAALTVHHLGAAMPAALLAGPLAAGLGALVFGWFCVRLSGVYLAMLTLAFAQITWSAAFQWVALTGGEVADVRKD